MLRKVATYIEGILREEIRECRERTCRCLAPAAPNVRQEVRLSQGRGCAKEFWKVLPLS